MNRPRHQQPSQHLRSRLFSLPQQLGWLRLLITGSLLFHWWQPHFQGRIANPVICISYRQRSNTLSIDECDERGASF